MIETVMGAVVLLVALAFIVFAFRSSGLSADGGYQVTAQFDDASGLNIGTEVRVAGVKVGTVSAQSLDPETFRAVVTMSIANDVKLPLDSSARILPDGLLGGNFIALDPGAEEDNLSDEGYIEITQGAINLVDLISRFVFNSGGDGAAQ